MSDRSLSLDVLVAFAANMINDDPFLAESTRRETVIKIRQFHLFLRDEGVSTIDEVTREHVESFVYLPTCRGRRATSPQASTRRNRRAAIRNLYRALRGLGYEVGDPTLDVAALLDRTANGFICVTEEIVRLREAAPLGFLRSPLPSLLALAEAGATNTEIAHLTASNINGYEVELPGNLRVEARVNRLTVWGHEAIAERLEDLEDDKEVLASSGLRQISNGAVSNGLRTIAEFAGLRDRGITINSIRAWRAREILLERKSLEDAAKFLGSRSLDAAAAMIGYRWGDAS